MNQLFLFGKNMTPIRKLLLMKLFAGGIPISEYTATGNPLSFNTNVAKPLSSLLIPFTPVQSGTGDPSPENVRPISGTSGVNVWHTGANLCGVEWESGAIKSTDGQGMNDDSMYRTADYFPVCGGQKYYVVDGTQYKRVYWYDKDKTFIEANTGSASEKDAPLNASYAKAVVVKESTPNPAETYSFNYPSTDTDYHPYSGNSYPVVFPALGKNLFDVGATFANPSDTTKSNKTKRIFQPYTYCQTYR